MEVGLLREWQHEQPVVTLAQGGHERVELVVAVSPGDLVDGAVAFVGLGLEVVVGEAIRVAVASGPVRRGLSPQPRATAPRELGDVPEVAIALDVVDDDRSAKPSGLHNPKCASEVPLSETIQAFLGSGLALLR